MRVRRTQRVLVAKHIGHQRPIAAAARRRRKRAAGDRNDEDSDVVIH